MQAETSCFSETVAGEADRKGVKHVRFFNYLLLAASVVELEGT